MSGDEATDAASLDAGPFSSWLAATGRALAGDADASVPCDGCTACCTSSQFVHIAPDETDTLDHIPGELLFAAPGWPRGHVLMGYDEDGNCPMLHDGACSIYEHRPRTCRIYDCRVFAATGVELDDEAKVGIAQRAARWRFAFADDDDHAEHAAVRAAAAYVRDRRDAFPPDVSPRTATQRAVMAVGLHDAWLVVDAASGRRVVVEPAAAAVRDVVAARWSRSLPT
jgi:Fe-S-cluster containining protein